MQLQPMQHAQRKAELDARNERNLLRWRRLCAWMVAHSLIGQLPDARTIAARDAYNAMMLRRLVSDD
jgi:hypothetical protein